MNTPPSEPIVVYPVAEQNGSTWRNNELRYSLRSLERFFRLNGGECPKVFVLSTAALPFLSDAVIVIPANGYIEAVQQAWELARRYSPTGDYLWMNDDIVFLKPTTPNDLYPARHTGVIKEGAPPERGGWLHKLRVMRDRLKEMGLEALNFSTHSPYLFNAYWMETVATLFGLRYKTPLETAYFNYWADRIPSQQGSECYTCLFPGETYNLGSARFANFTDTGLDESAKRFLETTFPVPSMYEC